MGCSESKSADNVSVEGPLSIKKLDYRNYTNIIVDPSNERRFVMKHFDDKNKDITIEQIII